MSLFVVPQEVRDAEAIFKATRDNKALFFLIRYYAEVGLEARGDQRRENWAYSEIARLNGCDCAEGRP